MRTALLAFTTILITSATFLRGQEQPRLYPIATESVVGAMGARGLTVDGVRVTLAAPVEASVENPVLDLAAVTPTGERSAQLLVTCRTRSQCPSFYASVKWDTRPAMGALAAPAGNFRQVSQPLQRRADSDSLSAVAVRAGARTELEIDGERVHIRLPVICLQSGVAGDRIHVSTIDRKQTFEAEVVDSSLMKARL
jgi:hypothetical protein